jgi:NAD(P)-dependent dehydrogenase (short-subunit alcohol dehydrogenase family)
MKNLNKIAVVTGANKGIGLETCKQLAYYTDLVILTARSKKRGEESVEILKKAGISKIDFCQLNVNSNESINAFYRFIKNKYNGRLDILINNAGIYINDLNCTEVDEKTVLKTLKTNFLGALKVTQKAIPLMIKNNYGRIVNVSSSIALLSNISEGNGAAYKISKLALNSITLMLSQELKNYNILINSVCPGWVKTDMTGTGAPNNIQEAVNSIVYAATLPNNTFSGRFFKNKKIIDW